MREYREIPPSPILSDYIQSFWVMTTDKLVKEQEIEVLPDGCFDIVIDIHKSKKNGVVLTGLWDKPVNVTIRPSVTTVGTRFYPAALPLFFNCKLRDIRNRILPLERAMLINPSSTPLEPLYQYKRPEELLNYLDEFYVLQFLEGKKQDNLYTSIKETIIEKSIQETADELLLHPRKLHRMYKNSFGISPKTYTNILRFIKTKDLLDAGEELMNIVFNCNYYDQAHFIKDFRKYAGVTPREYQKR